MSRFVSYVLSMVLVTSIGFANTSSYTGSTPYTRVLESVSYQQITNLDLLIATINLSDGSSFLHVTNLHSPSKSLAKWHAGDEILFDSATFQANNQRSMELTLINPARKNVFASITKDSLDALPTVSNIELREIHHLLHRNTKVLMITLCNGNVFYVDTEDHDLIPRLWKTGDHIAISSLENKEKKHHHYALLNLDAPSTLKYVTNDRDYRKLIVRTSLEE